MDKTELYNKMKRVKKGDKFEIATDGGEAVVLTADRDAYVDESLDELGYAMVHSIGAGWSNRHPTITHFEVVAPRPSWEGNPVVQDANGELWKYDGALYDSPFWKGYSASMVEAEHGPCKPLFSGDELLVPILRAAFPFSSSAREDDADFLDRVKGVGSTLEIKRVLGVDHD